MTLRTMTNPAITLKSMFHVFMLAAAACALSACGKSNSGAERPPLADAAVGGPFTLVGKDGKTVRWSDFDGRYRIVYFGYTFCPDACPTDMAVVGHALAKLEKTRPDLTPRIVPLFITVDPHRDTPQIVGEFAAHFSPRMIGLTGPKDEIDKAAKEFAVYYERGAGNGDSYLVNHSRTVYLMGPKGEPITLLPADKGPDAVADEIVKWVK